jgi:hypothetical protein
MANKGVFAATIGMRFGNLCIIGKPWRILRVTWCECLCDCGVSKFVRTGALLAGRTVSCGCARKAANVRDKLRNRQHGHAINYALSPTYHSWRGMKDRCRYPSNASWRNYGGRGIRVCDRWKVFENFLEDMGERPIDHTLDRVDPDGNYEPGNCRWATRIQQQRENRRSTRGR